MASRPREPCVLAGLLWPRRPRLWPGAQAGPAPRASTQAPKDPFLLHKWLRTEGSPPHTYTHAPQSPHSLGSHRPDAAKRPASDLKIKATTFSSNPHCAAAPPARRTGTPALGAPFPQKPSLPASKFSTLGRRLGSPRQLHRHSCPAPHGAAPGRPGWAGGGHIPRHGDRARNWTSAPTPPRPVIGFLFLCFFFFFRFASLHATAPR